MCVFCRKDVELFGCVNMGRFMAFTHDHLNPTVEDKIIVLTDSSHFQVLLLHKITIFNVIPSIIWLLEVTREIPESDLLCLGINTNYDAAKRLGYQ